jgi:hypothetical protein
MLIRIDSVCFAFAFYAKTSVGDIVTALAEAYRNRTEARKKGQAAAAFIRREFTWEVAVTGIISQMEQHVKQVHGYS